MYLRLRASLAPLFITTTQTDIFEETLLKAAGIETNPSACKFESDKKKLILKISGLTPSDAERFLAFLKGCGDENASSTLNKDAHHFTMGIELVQDKLMDHFEESLAVLPANVIAAYQLKSANDREVKNRKESLLDANNFHYLIKELNKFLFRNYLSEVKTGIFTKTFLNLAGITSEIEACQIGASNEKQMYFRIKGMNNQDAETFLSFLKDITKDETASLSYVEKNSVLDINNSRKRLEKAHEVLIDKQLAYSILLPLFTEKFSTIPKEKMDAYKIESLSDSAIKRRLNSDIHQQSEQIFEKLEEFLIPKLISPRHCSIFAETILRLAGVTKEPTHCKSSPIDRINMQFSYTEIDKVAAEQFLEFMTKLSQGFEVRGSFSIQKPQTYNCTVNMDIVMGYLLPMFKEEFSKLPAEKIVSYEKQSEAHEMIGLVILQNNLKDIILSAAMLEASCPDAFTKGELHIVNVLLKSFEHLIAQEPRDELTFIAVLSQAKYATNIYNNLFAESTVLNGNQEAETLNNKCEKMQKKLDCTSTPLSKFSIFPDVPKEKSDKPLVTDGYVSSKNLV